MATKIFEVNYYKWDIVDAVSGLSPTVRWSISLKRTNKWLSSFTKLAWSSHSFQKILNWIYSVIAIVNPLFSVVNKGIVDFRWFWTWTWTWLFYITSSNILFGSSWTTYVDSFPSTTPKDSKFQVVCVSWISVVCSSFELQNLFQLSWPLNWYMAYFAIYSWMLTQTEINNIQKQFLQLQPLLEKKNNFYYPKTKPQQTNYHFPMVVNSSILSDTSWSILFTKSWSIRPTKDWIKSDGINWVYECANSSMISLIEWRNIWTFYWRFKAPPSWALWSILFSCASSSVVWNQFYIVSGSFTGSLSNESFWFTVLRNNVIVYVVAIRNWTNYYNDNQWHNFSININWIENTVFIDGIKQTLSLPFGWSATTQEFSNIDSPTNMRFLSRRTTLAAEYFSWDLWEFWMSTTPRTDIEAKNYHNKRAKQVTFKETFAYDKADWTNIVPTGWIAGTGTYKLATQTLTSWELISNGDFSAGTWNIFTNRAIQVTWSSNIIEDSTWWPDGSRCPKFTVDWSAWACALDQSNILTIGKYYKVSITYKTTWWTWFFTNASSIAYYSWWTQSTYKTDTFYFTANTASIRISRNSANNQTMRIDNISIVEQQIPFIITWTKYLECTWSWTIAFPNNQAYWTMEFSLYKWSTATAPRFYFVSDAIAPRNGYRLWFETDESVRLAVFTNGWSASIMQTVASYIAVATWYRIRVTRSIAWSFTVYIKGWAFASWTLMAVVANNPSTYTTHTISKFCVFGVTTSDRIANITYKQWVEV